MVVFVKFVIFVRKVLSSLKRELVYKNLDDFVMNHGNFNFLMIDIKANPLNSC